MAAGVAVVDELDVSAHLTNEEIMLPLTHHGLAANYNDAAALTKQHSPQDHFRPTMNKPPTGQSARSIVIRRSPSHPAANGPTRPASGGPPQPSSTRR